jgi:hypothetical protein
MSVLNRASHVRLPPLADWLEHFRRPGLNHRFGSFLRGRMWVLGFAALVGTVLHGFGVAPPESSLDGLARWLGSAVSGTVAGDELVWEPSVGILSDLLWGRRILFLARRSPGAPRDVFRARVRLTPSGAPISVRGLRNLTETPVGDDAGLSARGHSAVFATVALGRIQGVSVLDLNGIPDLDRPASFFDRLLLAISEYQHTGDVSGLGRTDILFDLPAKAARLEVDERTLQLDLGEKGRELVYDMRSRELHGVDGAQAYAARAAPRIIRPKPFVLWAVDTVREEVGPGPVAWLENLVFGVKDRLKRAAYALLPTDDSKRLRARPETVGVSFSSSSGGLGASLPSSGSPTPLLDASELVASQTWPPPPVPSLWTKPKPGEGQWQAVWYPFLKPVPGTSPAAAAAYFYKTFIRPDPERPYAEVVLIAMDMRELELGIQAGFEDPQPAVGPPGEGRLPQDRHVLDRVVGTFNGAFKSTHGDYGMMVNRRLLVPPVSGSATVILTDSGDVGMGNWPQTSEIPADIRSFRQNLDPLVEDGRINPSGRILWGWQLQGTSVMTQRTALCVTPQGHLFYAFAKESNAPTLARALRQAGCSYAMHLDMNPGHCGFVFTNIVDAKKGVFNLELADPDMKLPPARFVTWSAKDFFYVMMRDPRPHDTSGVRWELSEGAQPPPAELPAVFTGTLSVGSISVQLMSLEPRRLRWVLVAGSKEPRNGASRQTLPDSDVHRAIAAIGMGHTTSSTGYGLSVAPGGLLPLRRSYPTLLLRPEKLPEILLPSSQPEIGSDQQAVQLPLLAVDGKLLDTARARGGSRDRSALCVTPTGRVLVAWARHDSTDVVASALLQAGCDRVLELDRGSHHPAFIHRTGTSTPPMRSYETSTLHLVAEPMVRRAFRWKHEKAKPSDKPTGVPRISKKNNSDAGSPPPGSP